MVLIGMEMGMRVVVRRLGLVGCERVQGQRREGGGTTTRLPYTHLKVALTEAIE
jgi:hypothetical protein